MFRRFVSIADWCWNAVSNWTPLAQHSMGLQLVRAIDSVGANLVEGDGRSTDPDSARFFVIARASARETRYWLTRARDRKLIPLADADSKLDDLIVATKMLNKLIAYRRKRFVADRVSEERAVYTTDPFYEPPA